MEASAKGSSLTFIRKKIKGSEIEKKFLEKLTTDEKEAFESALAFSWVPVKVVAGIFEKGALMLYPGDKKTSLRKFGKESMMDDLKGIYRVAMHFTSMNFAIEQLAKVWATYYNAGQASHEKSQTKGKAALIVKNFPDFPLTLTETVAGSFEGMAELHKCKYTKITYQAIGAGDHKWMLEWQ